MTPNDHLSIGQCAFCEQGLLRPMRCRSCAAIVAVCDECELIWDDIGKVRADLRTPSSGAHPTCPACGERQQAWELLTRSELDAEGLGDLVD